MKIVKLALFALFILFIFSNAFAAEKRYTLPIENSPYIGNENAPVTIIEFIDYQ